MLTAKLEQALNLKQGLSKNVLDLLPSDAFFIRSNDTPGFTTAAQELLGEVYLLVRVKDMLIENL